jgi:hypothetical protein
VSRIASSAVSEFMSGSTERGGRCDANRRKSHSER